MSVSRASERKYFSAEEWGGLTGRETAFLDAW